MVKAEQEDLRSRVTSAVTRLEGGTGVERRAAADQLMPAVYDELRRLAGALLRHERSGHTLQPTALVHEVYLRLVDQDRVSWQGRSHFLALGARMMRRVLVDHARRRCSAKRGGSWCRVTFENVSSSLSGRPLSVEEMVALDLALDRLAEVDPRQAQVVEMRFFGGLGMAEVAALVGVSKRTVEGDWTHARAWLRRELAGAGRKDP